VAYYLPRKWRSSSTNRVLDLTQACLDRIDKSLDLKCIYNSQLDVEQLLNSSVADAKTKWMFKQHSGRFVRLNSDKVTSNELRLKEALA
jgi:hypothetical protein